MAHPENYTTFFTVCQLSAKNRAYIPFYALYLKYKTKAYFGRKTPVKKGLGSMKATSPFLKQN